MENRPSVLVVDDEVAVCNSCMKTFTREGYDVDYSLNGEEALKKIAVGDYDLVVTDLKMPKVDGLQLLRTVKARWPEVNVIMITGYGTIRSAVEAMKLGAFDYISKPFTAEDLAGVAARALGLTELHREEEEPVLYFPIVFSHLEREELDHMWCLPQHAWVKVREDRTVEIGVDALYRRLIGGEITAVEFPGVGEHLRQGEACAVMVVKNSEAVSSSVGIRHNLWCPVDGTVVGVNEEVRRELSMLARSPYGNGWLIRLKPARLEDDLKNLKPFTESIGGRVALKHLGSAGDR